jgi:hypothetical protein
VRQRAEGAVGGGVAVAAHDGGAGQREALFRPDDVDDALALVGLGEVLDAEVGCVLCQCLDLDAAFFFFDAVRAVGGRHVVVDHGERLSPGAHLAAGHAQAFKGLRAGDFVHQVAVDVEQAGAVFLLREPGGRPRSCRRVCVARAWSAISRSKPRTLPRPVAKSNRTAITCQGRLVDSENSSIRAIMPRQRHRPPAGSARKFGASGSGQGLPALKQFPVMGRPAVLQADPAGVPDVPLEPFIQLVGSHHPAAGQHRCEKPARCTGCKTQWFPMPAKPREPALRSAIMTAHRSFLLMCSGDRVTHEGLKFQRNSRLSP